MIRSTQRRILGTLMIVLMVGCERATSADADLEPQEPPAAATADPAPPDDDDARPAGEIIPEIAPEEVSAIYDVLAEAVKAAVKVNTFDDLVERFVREDRRRLGRVGAGAIREETTTFRDKWRERFDGEFSITDPSATLRNMVRIDTVATPSQSADEPERARVLLQAREPGQPTLELFLAKERDRWRIDIPDHYERESFRDAFANRVLQFNEQESLWTAEHLAAERDVAYGVLSLLGTPVAEEAPAQPAAAPGQ